MHREEEEERRRRDRCLPSLLICCKEASCVCVCATKPLIGAAYRVRTQHRLRERPSIQADIQRIASSTFMTAAAPSSSTELRRTV